MVYRISGQNPLITPENPTSNEFGNYRISTNSNRSDWNCQAYYAFTSTITGKGWSSNNGDEYWIKWQYLDNPKKIVIYEVVTMYNNGQHGTTSWKLEGSNDDTNWVTVDERSNSGEYKVVEYICNGIIGNYSYYRLISTKVNTHTYFNKIKAYQNKRYKIKKNYRNLCWAKKYNNFYSIDCEAQINANNIFLEGNLFYSLCANSYEKQLYNCTFENNVLSFNKGYYLLKKKIQFTDQFDIYLQFDLNDYSKKSIILMNDDENSGFRLSLNKYKHENKILFQIYETNGIKYVECEYSNLFNGFNKLEIKLKDKKLKMFLNDDLMCEETIIGDILNSEQYLCIGAYYKDNHFSKTLNGNLRNIKILKKCI